MLAVPVKHERGSDKRNTRAGQSSEVLTVVSAVGGTATIGVRQGTCDAQVFVPNTSPVVGHGLESQRSMPLSDLRRNEMSIRINLDLEPEYEAFVKEWADKLGIPLSELMRRVVHETCNGYRYDEKIPDYFPLERRPDWKRLDRRRDRRKKREAARLN